MKISTVSSLFIGATLLWAGHARLAADEPEDRSVFGSAQRSAGALIGILYDFKQNQKRQPVPMDRHLFETLVAQFIDNGWDEGLLNGFYRVPRAMYATEILMPTMNADLGPRVFGAEKTVEPRMWMVHYKGQVAAPTDGTYRFLGDADDFMAVAVDGKTVLVADIPGTRLQVRWFAREPEVQLHGRHGGRFTPGDWIDLRAGSAHRSGHRPRRIARRPDALPDRRREKGRRLPRRDAALPVEREQEHHRGERAVAGRAINKKSPPF